MILAGIDEAGYGPTLGPLVVAGTAFRLPEDGSPRPPEGKGSVETELPNLWKLLTRSTSRKPGGDRTPVNDSKKLYQGPKGLRYLEEGGLAFLQLCDGGIPRDFRALLKRLSGSPSGDAYLDLYPWYRGQNPAVPTLTYLNYLCRSAQRLREDMGSRGIEMMGIRALPMEVVEFNRRLDRLKNKSQVSFIAVGELLRRIWSSYPGERIEAMVDRQGGRMYYAPLLYRKIRPRGIRILEESDFVSRYELSRDGPPMRVTFAVDCEAKCFPVALASMFCKYVRELHMSIFNAFWVEQVKSLRLTAGYFLDARRFLGEIAAARRELGVDDALLIRRR